MARKPASKTTRKRSTRKAPPRSVANLKHGEIPADLLSDPATVAMFSRMNTHNKPPIKWLRQADGSWLECYLMPDGTYGNCDPVAPDVVPPAIRDA
jgi:hypothetical protein